MTEEEQGEIDYRSNNLFLGSEYDLMNRNKLVAQAISRYALDLRGWSRTGKVKPSSQRHATQTSEICRNYFLPFSIN
jgi:hypothetical protein